MKLNIGSSNLEGKYRNADWINIDSGDGNFSGNVMKVDALDMPGEWTDYFDEVHAIHVLEHVNRNKRFDFLVACRRVMKPGATLYLEVPNFEQVIRNLLDAIDSRDHEEEHRMTTSLFGKQRYAGDQHCWGFTQRTLSELAARAKFSSLVVYLGPDESEQMVSMHYVQEPVLLLKAVK